MIIDNVELIEHHIRVKKNLNSLLYTILNKKQILCYIVIYLYIIY